MNGACRVARAAQAVACGGVIAYPTEGCYGLGCDPKNRAAVTRLLSLKRRSWRKGLILIADGWARLAPFVDDLPQTLADEIHASWPGPVTWLLPASTATPAWLRGESSQIAVRITAHPLSRRLCRHARRALVSTSANRAGRPPLLNARAVARAFPGQLDAVLPGALATPGKVSQIRDGLTGEYLRV